MQIILKQLEKRMNRNKITLKKTGFFTSSKNSKKNQTLIFE